MIEEKIEEYTRTVFDQHKVVFEEFRGIAPGLASQVAGLCLNALRSGGKILFFGNGGSAADAQHLATELTVRFEMDRPALAAMALTTNTSSLTAVGNDYGFEDLFARQIEAFCGGRDVAIGISTSGNSENVIRGLVKAKQIGAKTVLLTGRSGGRAKAIADCNVLVPSDNTARIQEMHILFGHILCGAIEREIATT